MYSGPLMSASVWGWSAKVIVGWLPPPLPLPLAGGFGFAASVTETGTSQFDAVNVTEFTEGVVCPSVATATVTSEAGCSVRTSWYV